jgi:gliding motility-associated-like protein
VNFSHDGAHGVTQWQWAFDNNSANTQQAQLQLPALGEYHVALAVSNGFCADTFATTVVLDDAVKAAFEIPEALCPQDSAIFRDQSGGRVTAWSWDFGNGDGSTDQLPRPQFYPIDLTDRQYPVRLIVFNSAGCSDTLMQSLKVVANCRIDIPSAFTPNGDGLNDYLYPLNAYKASDLLFRVYNRYGQMVFETRDWKARAIGSKSLPRSNPAATMRGCYHIHTKTPGKDST